MQWLVRATLLLSITALSVRASAAEQAAPTEQQARDRRPTFVGTYGGTAGSSAWRGDPIGLSSLKLGFRFFDFITPYYLGRLGYAEVNDRSVLTLSFGVQAGPHLGIARPYVRASIVHQHEESMAAIKADVGGALTGVGDGIRHRSGPEFGLGVDLSIHRERKTELFGAIEASTLYFPDPRGPSLYVLGSLALGLNFTL